MKNKKNLKQQACNNNVPLSSHIYVVFTLKKLNLIAYIFYVDSDLIK